MNISIENYKVQLLPKAKVINKNDLVILRYSSYKDIVVSCQLPIIKTLLGKLKKPLKLKNILEQLSFNDGLFFMEIIRKLMYSGFLKLSYFSKSIGAVDLIPMMNQFMFYKQLPSLLFMSKNVYIRYNGNYLISDVQGQAYIKTSSLTVIELIRKLGRNYLIKPDAEDELYIIALLFQAGIFHNKNEDYKNKNWSFHEILFYRKEETAVQRKIHTFLAKKKIEKKIN